MKKFTLILALFVLLLTNININALDANAMLQKQNKQFFIENKGQWASEVLYLTKIGGLNAWITKSGVVYDYYKIEVKEKQDVQHLGDVGHLRDIEQQNTSIKGHVVKMELSNSPFVKGGQGVSSEGLGKLDGYYNYFLGNDQNKWASYVSLYEEVKINNVYNGVAVRYYHELSESSKLSESLRYDFIVSPFANPSQIKMRFEGQENIFINENGELIYITRFGEVKNAKLFAYQEKDVQHLGDVGHLKKQIPCSFTQNPDGSISFTLGNYDYTKPLIIDPLIYSTFLGSSSSQDYIYSHGSMKIDNEGNVNITGYTNSTAFPTTSGVYDESFNGNRDVFVTKLNASGSALIYSTFLGGSADDRGFSLALDSEGNAYVTGYTTSTNFPTTSGAYDVSSNYYDDVFITKLNASGSALIYSTYLGGGGSDIGFFIALDNEENAYITGRTYSSNFPTTADAFDVSLNGYEAADIFVTKLNANGSALIYSTFLGGSGSDVAMLLLLMLKVMQLSTALLGIQMIFPQQVVLMM